MLLIIACNNTSTSKLVYDYVSGFRRQNDDGSSTFQQGWTLGRWAFAELTEIYQIDADFKARVDHEVDAMLARAGGAT